GRDLRAADYRYRPAQPGYLLGDLDQGRVVESSGHQAGHAVPAGGWPEQDQDHDGGGQPGVLRRVFVPGDVEGTVLMQVRIRNRDLQQRVTLQAVSGKMVLRNNSPSSWSINVNANEGNWDRFEEGWGVSLTDSGIFYISGQVLEIEDEETEDGVRTLA